MAQVKKISYGAYQPTVSGYVSFFTSFNCPLMEVSSSAKKCIVTMPDTFKATFDLEPAAAQSSTFQSIIMEYNGNSTRYASECVVSRGTNILCACSNDFVYIDHWNGWGNHFEIIYERTSNHSFYSWKDGSNTLTAMPVNDIGSGLSYSIGSVLNFSNDTGVISITNAALFRSGVKSIIDSNFLCCTPVTKGNKILVGEDVFYAIDSNILVPYEEVENG